MGRCTAMQRKRQLSIKGNAERDRRASSLLSLLSAAAPIRFFELC
uniref:Bm8809, isoform b n=1 Tax=Brugia malayi TaxID=6279 RepID=A0A1I9G0A8_BRUMA|nr:Bm8809, isoform b [Brugia malayi]